MAYVFSYTVHNFKLFAYRSWLVAFMAYSASTQPGWSLLFSATAWAAIANIFVLPVSVLGNELSRRIGRHKAIRIIMWVSALFRCLFRFAAELPFIVVAVLLVLLWSYPCRIFINYNRNGQGGICGITWHDYGCSFLHRLYGLVHWAFGFWHNL